MYIPQPFGWMQSTTRNDLTCSGPRELLATNFQGIIFIKFIPEELFLILHAECLGIVEKWLQKHVVFPDVFLAAAADVFLV